MRLADELLKAASPVTNIAGRKIERPSNAISVRGWREEGSRGAEPPRTTYVGIVESHCIRAVDNTPTEASWADLPRTFAKDGLFGGPRKS